MPPHDIPSTAPTDPSAWAATSVLAEDEPLLAQALVSELARAWPGLRLVARAEDGPSAVEQALAHLPDVLFLDIRMPGCSGLEAAQAVVEDWPADRALPLIVFVTAYDQYALQAFEAAAVDYVLKPVAPARLAATCDRLRTVLRGRAPGPGGTAVTAAAHAGDPLLERLRALLGPAGMATMPPAPAPETLQVIAASSAGGAVVEIVPVQDVVYFEAADKYVRVLTAHAEHLIRTSLRELLPRLDPQRFWQVHRGTVVQVQAVERALRDEAGRVQLVLRQRPERLSVSRLYAARFKGM
ncbi:LytR/AlgR family response regulator transcription factor [Ideonella sp.]|uniref:LytR/AlgR family response regulator transcription factor n=1 Tax=Ideonella sp. TaxID=1929293 RepID=UPI0035B0B43C